MRSEYGNCGIARVRWIRQRIAFEVAVLFLLGLALWDTRRQPCTVWSTTAGVLERLEIAELSLWVDKYIENNGRLPQILAPPEGYFPVDVDKYLLASRNLGDNQGDVYLIIAKNIVFDGPKPYFGWSSIDKRMRKYSYAEAAEWGLGDLLQKTPQSN